MCVATYMYVPMSTAQLLLYVSFTFKTKVNMLKLCCFGLIGAKYKANSHCLNYATVVLGSSFSYNQVCFCPASVQHIETVFTLHTIACIMLARLRVQLCMSILPHT